MRVAVLWPQLSGYADAAFTALVDQGHEVLVIHRSALPDAPFDDDEFDRYPRLAWTDSPPHQPTIDAVEQLDPDLVLMSAWHGRTYRAVMRSRRGRSVRVLGMDNQWRGTPKQWLGRATAARYLRPAYDCALVSGERQVRFAQLLGFPDHRITQGFCTADVPAFDGGPRPDAVSSRRFLFVGRLVPEKGVDVLAAAYAQYRREAGPAAWGLSVAGVGPLASAFDGTGAHLLGFLPPRDLPRVMRDHTALVLPSRFEPWGVVVHEAAAAGCSLICSDAVGAVTAFLREPDNGLRIPVGDVDALTNALHELSGWSSDRHRTGAAVSRDLARQLTPATWAEGLVETWRRVGGELGLVHADRDELPS